MLTMLMKKLPLFLTKISKFSNPEYDRMVHSLFSHQLIVSLDYLSMFDIENG